MHNRPKLDHMDIGRQLGNKLTKWSLHVLYLCPKVHGVLVVLVKKNNGEFRFCVQYRQHTITKKNVYPLPRMDETPCRLGGVSCFSTFAFGYLQVSKVSRWRGQSASFWAQTKLFSFAWSLPLYVSIFSLLSFACLFVWNSVNVQLLRGNIGSVK